MSDKTEFFAAIDLGSNSFHAVIARNVGEPASSNLMVVDRHKESVRLAAGLDGNDVLSEETQASALACLDRFKQLLNQIPPSHIRAVGTNTLRRAGNGNDFLQRAEAALGVPIDIISGLEEARLIYQGVSHDLGDAPDRRLVVDIGGGSTEFIHGLGETPLMMDSLQIGCVRLTQQYFRDKVITQETMNKALTDVRHELAPVKRRWRKAKWDIAIGASGTAQAIGQVLAELHITDGTLTADGLETLADICVAAGNSDALNFSCLSSDRSLVFPAGVAAMLSIFRTLKIKQMQPVETALREGVLQDLSGSSNYAEIRQRSVEQLAQRHHLDLEHGLRVERTAERILAKLAADWEIDVGSYSPLLHWAGRLHEIGLSIGHKNYHQHGAYILRNSNLPAFSHRDQESIALLILAQRKRFPVESFESSQVHSAKRLLQLQKLAAVLRIAIILHRTRNPDRVPEVAAIIKEGDLCLTFPSAWLESHPMVSHDLLQEKSKLLAAGITLRFE
ncbi:MAG: exopolyphosphatase/guanosine-5'-triphosphate,3'-diphosphate pyrophosphatase, partial [Gammaproteobacteria bacterium]|jgi:exopolyphosphatase/guanosine-5'-triphosphate,3'-diphosphate pyrophosphatase